MLRRCFGLGLVQQHLVFHVGVGIEEQGMPYGVDGVADEQRLSNNGAGTPKNDSNLPRDERQAVSVRLRGPVRLHVARAVVEWLQEH